MRISFQLNAASPLQIKDFFRKLEVPVELTVQGTYRGETHYYFHRPEHSWGNSLLFSSSGAFHHFVCHFRRHAWQNCDRHGRVVFIRRL